MRVCGLRSGPAQKALERNSVFCLLEDFRNKLWDKQLVKETIFQVRSESREDSVPVRENRGSAFSHRPTNGCSHQGLNAAKIHSKVATSPNIKAIRRPHP